MANFYCGSVQWSAITQFAVSHAYSVGDIVRQLAAPSEGNERAFRCTTAGTSGGSESAWNLGLSATTNQGTAVFTEVTGNPTYAWAAASARIGLITGRVSGGDTIFLASNHAELGAADVAIGINSGVDNPVSIYSVNPAGATPPTDADLATGAVIQATSSDLRLQANGAYFWGVTFRCGTGTGTACSFNFRAFGGQCYYVLDNCRIELNNTNSGSAIGFYDNSPVHAVMRNTTVKFGAVGHGFGSVGRIYMEWIGGGIDGAGSTPTRLFKDIATSNYFRAILSGVDINTVTDLYQEGSSIFQLTLNACRINSSLAIDLPNLVRSTWVNVVNCNNGTANYDNRQATFAGRLTTESVVVKSGGATDGTTPVSWKIATSANARRNAPFEAAPIVLWGDTSGGAKTITVDVLTDGVTLTNAEAWVEVEYLGNGSYPLASLIDDKALNLATPANQTTSTETWTTTGIGSPVKQKLEVTLTPNLKGLFKVKVRVAKASTTVYVDPKPVVS